MDKNTIKIVKDTNAGVFVQWADATLHVASVTLMNINNTHERSAYWFVKNIISSIRTWEHYVLEISNHFGALESREPWTLLQCDIAKTLAYFVDDRDITRLEIVQSRADIVTARLRNYRDGLLSQEAKEVESYAK